MHFLKLTLYLRKPSNPGTRVQRTFVEEGDSTVDDGQIFEDTNSSPGILVFRTLQIECGVTSTRLTEEQRES